LLSICRTRLTDKTTQEGLEVAETMAEGAMVEVLVVVKAVALVVERSEGAWAETKAAATMEELMVGTWGTVGAKLVEVRWAECSAET
jgi:hypothetical protein